ncbi:TIGR02588 family protein [Lusitaniella coriacea]|uniref:TIGR02588 family protein n=1 Tax=Lusitaniella coriacea TaxID=1983105 RepID=UPI003CE675B2
MSHSEESTARAAEDKSPTRSRAEWVSFSLSLVILSAVVGLVLYRWVATKDQPPVISVTSDPEIRKVEGQFYLPYTVTNTGGGTAESVEITAQLVIAGEVEEEGSQNIDFLSEGEIKSGAFIFQHNPAQGKLILRATGYKLP